MLPRDRPQLDGRDPPGSVVRDRLRRHVDSDAAFRRDLSTETSVLDREPKDLSLAPRAWALRPPLRPDALVPIRSRSDACASPGLAVHWTVESACRCCGSVFPSGSWA